MKKKITLTVLSLIAVYTLIGGTIVYAINSSQESHMMKAMNSPEGKQMIAECTDFMKKYQDNDQNK